MGAQSLKQMVLSSAEAAFRCPNPPKLWNFFLPMEKIKKAKNECDEYMCNTVMCSINGVLYTFFVMDRYRCVFSERFFRFLNRTNCGSHSSRQKKRLKTNCKQVQQFLLYRIVAIMYALHCSCMMESKNVQKLCAIYMFRYFFLFHSRAGFFITTTTTNEREA